MRLGQKRTCKNCMLVERNGCLAGFRTEKGTPKEPCYKPTTRRQEHSYWVLFHNMAVELRGA